LDNPKLHAKLGMSTSSAERIVEAILHETKRQAIQSTDAQESVGDGQSKASTAQNSKRGHPSHQTMIKFLNDSIPT
jgi:hypothetical protein